MPCYMSPVSALRSHVAPIRFGYGLRADEAPPADPEGWLLGQLAADAPTLPYTPLAALQAASRAERPVPAGRPAAEPEPALLGTRISFGALLRTEELAWIEHRLASGSPFRDRLVDFWANHLTISRRIPGIAPYVPAYEHEAIRPHVVGRFEDMLIAATRHPAMLHYLGNHVSVGPNSEAGRNGRRGLNENLARELLELHTLSPAAGYTQGDVEALAAILTGWGIQAAPATHGFRFQAVAHEPGPKLLLGRRFGQGEEGGLAALRFLANHPATCRHLAIKLVRHFVADQPPPADVARIASVLEDTGCDLGAAARALVALPAAWEPPLSRFRSPRDYMLATGRALGGGNRLVTGVLRGMRETGQQLWAVPAPDGWPDTAANWISPDTLLRRIEVAHALARVAPAADPIALAGTLMGPLLRPETATAIGRAPSRIEAMALLLGSPEWMRR